MERGLSKDMRKTIIHLAMLLAFSFLLAACGGQNSPSASESQASNAAPSTSSPSESASPAVSAPSSESAVPATKKISYLGEEYELPASTERIVITGAVEAMEDAILLDVKPVGAITFSGVFPPMFASITTDAQSIGEKTEPNFETILSLKPDVILGSTKFKPEVVEQLKKIAPTILYSHIATNWEANVMLLGELAGKQEQAAQAIAQYKADLETAKAKLAEKLKDKKVVAARIRSGDIYLYPTSVFFNPVLYEDLGLTPPAEVQAAKAQEMISIEKFAEMDPDYLFIQFSSDENKDNPNAWDQLQNNPILKNIKALKNGATYVNLVDPLAQGGTAYSKIEFLKSLASKLSE